ncbi:AfsR/SARP family transcriptional regulator, partial [Allokutzneria albata]|uniref:DNA-binding transcriptional activator of the SARP family n=1 Tax=Allokutzneria albata TaxID=211114 RepID=A0A1H0CQG0_ALLAB
MTGELEFRILGRLMITRGGEEVVVQAMKHRALLACLLTTPNTVVPVRRLVDRIWGDSPPEDARAVVHTYVSRLRAKLGCPGLVETLPEGYRLHVREQQLDLLRFRALVRRSTEETDVSVTISLLRRAISEWAGLALSDVDSEPLHRNEVARIHAEWNAPTERLIELLIAHGRHDEVLPLLRYLVSENPSDERLRGQLMIALYRSGNQAAVVSVYQDLRARLGKEPDLPLRVLYQRILRADPALLTPAAPDRETFWPVCQLPSGNGDLVGRTAELAEVTSAPVGATVLVSGPPGIGKTALAIHAAHRMKANFPDGQLYADLSRERALPRFLRALGMQPREVTADEAWLRARYRALLAGRRVLVVLDNAANCAQLRPLLPMTSSCTVLVTSRNELRGLTAEHDIRRVRLDELTPGAAEALMASLRCARSAALTEIIERCGGFPLALRIAAANVLDGGAESFVDKLRTGLSVLTVDGDPAADLRSAFDQSYNALPAEAQHVFTALARAGLGEFSVDEATALVQVPATAALEQLCDANLIRNTAADHFRFPALLRQYALAFDQ